MYIVSNAQAAPALCILFVFYLASSKGATQLRMRSTMILSSLWRSGNTLIQQTAKLGKIANKSFPANTSVQLSLNFFEMIVNPDLWV